MQVMLHTFMDSLRVDDNRIINLHGQQRGVNDHINGNAKRIKVFPIEEESIISSRTRVPTYKDTTQRNEEEKVKAVEAFYDKATISSLDYLEITGFATKKGIPTVIITFTILYWSYGLFYYYNSSV